MKFELTLKQTSLGDRARGIPPDFVILPIKVDKALIKLNPGTPRSDLAYFKALRIRREDYSGWMVVGLTDNDGRSVPVPVVSEVTFP